MEALLLCAPQGEAPNSKLLVHVIVSRRGPQQTLGIRVAPSQTRGCVVASTEAGVPPEVSRGDAIVAANGILTLDQSAVQKALTASTAPAALALLRMTTPAILGDPWPLCVRQVTLAGARALLLCCARMRLGAYGLRGARCVKLSVALHCCPTDARWFTSAV